MANFNIAFEKTLKFEGGYVNNKYDSGKETKYGISKKYYPDLDIKNLTLNQIKEIYKRDYWDKINGDNILNQEVANNIFDASVNVGIRRAVKLAQSQLGVKTDGILGKITLNYLNRFDPLYFVDLYKYSRIRFYTLLCRLYPKNKRFFYGWVNRTIKV